MGIILSAASYKGTHGTHAMAWPRKNAMVSIVEMNGKKFVPLIMMIQSCKIEANVPLLPYLAPSDSTEVDVVIKVS